jgi:hypothetical protein
VTDADPGEIRPSLWRPTLASGSGCETADVVLCRDRGSSERQPATKSVLDVAPEVFDALAADADALQVVRNVRVTSGRITGGRLNALPVVVESFDYEPRSAPGASAGSERDAGLAWRDNVGSVARDRSRGRGDRRARRPRRHCRSADPVSGTRLRALHLSAVPAARCIGTSSTPSRPGSTPSLSQCATDESQGLREVLRVRDDAGRAVSSVFRRAPFGPACPCRGGGLACRWARVTDVAKRRRQEL